MFSPKLYYLPPNLPKDLEDKLFEECMNYEVSTEEQGRALFYVIYGIIREWMMSASGQSPTADIYRVNPVVPVAKRHARPPT